MDIYLKSRRPIFFDGRILERLTIFRCPKWLASEFVKYKLCEYYEIPDDTPGNPYGEVTAQAVEEVKPKKKATRSKKEGSK